MAMCSKDMGPDIVIAWPTAQIAVLGADAACNIIFRKEIGGAEDPEAKRAELIQEYDTLFNNPMSQLLKVILTVSSSQNDSPDPYQWSGSVQE